MNLGSFSKPSRYIGSEINASGLLKRGLRTDSAGKGIVGVALAFPDLYEVGMSHLGIRVLYEIVNSLPFAFAERVFSPWVDVEEYLRTHGVPLASLESGIPLMEFDIVGFSLQYELSYTTVLNMLSLGGIPLRAEERRVIPERLPLIVAGGPCTVNPGPMSAFIDAFLVGDGEEAIGELVGTVRDAKTHGNTGREALLSEVARLEGFYVPSVHGRGCQVKRRYVRDLDSTPYPVRPVVPYMGIVHDRLTMEVSRGCTKGCRFCQAGMIYRPLRQRSPDTILTLAEESLKHTGYEEVSFSSLSAGDYECLVPLMREFNRRYRSRKIAVSLPSLRVGAVNSEVLREIRSVRKTGFTMAPEAATARLRSVVNKDFSDEDYERALTALFGQGWLSLKLYFMIGLPTERDEDIEAIPDMASSALRIAKKGAGRFVNLSVTVSPFVPKAHTPFQWRGQAPLEEMKRKLVYLKETFTRRGIKYKGHHEEASLLEAVFARGDEKLSDLIESAWRSGCRLDGWSELFDFRKWMHAMHCTGIDAARYAERSFDLDVPLPWDVVDVGVGKEFLRREYLHALETRMTVDCGEECGGCDLDCRGGVEEPRCTWMPPHHDAGPKGADAERHEGPMVRVRARFSKSGSLRFLSHLEVATAVTRALRRAGVPLAFSKGFHPSPKISFGPALGVGVAGEREYFDFEMAEDTDPEALVMRINETLPEGLRISRMEKISRSEPSLSNFVARYVYRISGLRNGARASIQTEATKSADTLPAGGPLFARRNGSVVDISSCIAGLQAEEGASRSEDGKSLCMTLQDQGALKVRVGEVIEALWGKDAGEVSVTRTALLGWKDGWVEPL